VDLSFRSDKTNVPQTLLLADDSVTIQRVIELTFADEDIKVIAVSDGDQAIERIEADPPDIVLADIGMPGRTGYEVALHIKRSPRLAHIPVVLLTGAFEPVDQAKADEVGCDGLLAKPFEPQQVIARVKELLGHVGHEVPVNAVNAVNAVNGVHADADTLTVPEPGAEALAPSFATPAPPAPTVSRPPEVTRLDKYFDRLDAAFATLSEAGPSEPKAVLPLPDLLLSPVQPAVGPSYDADLEFGRAPEPRRLPESEPAPRGAGPAAATPPPASPVSPVSPVNEVPTQLEPQLERVPALADAFAALLAAEQREPRPQVAPQWPSSSMPPASLTAAFSGGGSALGEDVIEEITRRVLDRLSDRVVRETTANLVSQVAERLVREEIDRIKASIK